MILDEKRTVRQDRTPARQQSGRLRTTTYGTGRGSGSGSGSASSFFGFNKMDRAAIFLIFCRTFLLASFLCGAKVMNRNKVTSRINEIFKVRILARCGDRRKEKRISG